MPTAAIERKRQALQIRDTVHRAAHAEWSPPADRADPLELLRQSNEGRLEDLIPLRFERMADSAFAFFRGSAIIMANDLVHTPNTGIHVQSCGDCHLQNFGWFATPERNLAFDVTDFDETMKGPWEWDLKRLATSFVLAAKTRGQGKHLAQAVCESYRVHMAEFSRMPAIQVWYARLDVPFLSRQLKSRRQLAALKSAVTRSQTQTIEKWLPKHTTTKKGKLQFQKTSQDVVQRPEPEFHLKAIKPVVDEYRTSLQEDRRELLTRYQLVDVGFKIVGVGSVGLRCLVGLLVDDRGQPLVLQIKEARPSVFAPLLPPDGETHQGHRIVYGQRLMQSASDAFLGWGQGPHGRDYYVRQLRDMKLTFDPAEMTYRQLSDYAQLCGWALARAHAKSGKSPEITGYLGASDKFDRAVAEFALVYAEQVKADFEAFSDAVGE